LCRSVRHFCKAVAAVLGSCRNKELCVATKVGIAVQAKVGADLSVFK